LCREIRLAQRIRDTRAGEELKQQDRVLWRCRIELGERWKAPLGEIERIPSAHRRDPRARRHGRNPRLDRVLDVDNRSGGLKPGVVPGSQAQQDEMVVVIDQPRDGGTAMQINYARTRVIGRMIRAAHRLELSIAYLR